MMLNFNFSCHICNKITTIISKIQKKTGSQYCFICLPTKGNIILFVYLSFENPSSSLIYTVITYQRNTNFVIKVYFCEVQTCAGTKKEIVT